MSWEMQTLIGVCSIIATAWVIAISCQRADTKIPKILHTCHSGDCTIYATIDNGNPTDGVCTCGYGLEVMRQTGDDFEMVSKARSEEHERLKSRDGMLKRIDDSGNRAAELAKSITKNWPEWKRNMLAQSMEAKAFETREALGGSDGY